MSHTEQMPGHCPACDGPTRIRVTRLDEHSTRFECVLHPELAHTLRLEQPLPFSYVVVGVDPDGEPWSPNVVVDTEDLSVFYATPQAAEAGAEDARWRAAGAMVATGRGGLMFAVATVTLIEDFA